MKIESKYVVYELIGILSSDNKALRRIYFNEVENLFNSKEDAISSLVEENMTDEEYLIIKQVYIR